MNGHSNKKLPHQLIHDGVKWMLLPSKIILDGLCVWPEDQNRFTLTVHLLLLIGYLLVITGQLAYMNDSNVDLVSKAYAISFFILNIETVVRRLVCYIYKERLQEVLSAMYYRFWPSNIAGSSVQEELSRDSWKFFLGCASYTIVAFLWALQVNIMSLFHGNLPLRTKQPLHWHEEVLYASFYILEGIMSVEVALNVCGLDLFFVSLLSNCSAQFKLLRMFLRQQFEDLISSKGGKKVEPLGLLVLCIKRHSELISICREIERIFTFFILVQYLASIGTVCLSSFVATVVPQEFVTALTLLTGHVCEIFIYCYMGENLIFESTELSIAVYECGWNLMETDTKFQKSLILIMIRAQRAVKMSAGGFGYLSLSSFMRLIQFSFSVYTFLNKMENKRDLQ